MYNTQMPYGAQQIDMNSVFKKAVSSYNGGKETENSRVFNEKEKKTLVLENPVDFPSQIETQMMTTYDLCRIVNQFFKTSVGDYYGSICNVDQMTGKLNMELYFRENINADKDKTFTIKRVTDNMRNGYGSRVNPSQMIQNISNIVGSNSRLYTLTDVGKEYLYDFIIKDINTPFEKINWNQFCVEQHEQVYMQQNIFVKVTGIDINAILRTIFGNRREISKDENGVKYSYYDYTITVVRPVGVGYTSGQNYLITIQRFDQHEVEKLAAKVGLVSTVGSIPIIRDTIIG